MLELQAAIHMQLKPASPQNGPLGSLDGIEGEASSHVGYLGVSGVPWRPREFTKVVLGTLSVPSGRILKALHAHRFREVVVLNALALYVKRPTGIALILLTLTVALLFFFPALYRYCHNHSHCYCF